jgi:DNA-binding Xre family transcriptional regulator
MMSNKHIGSNFDDFLEENSLLADAQAIACSRIVAWEIEQYLAKSNTTKTEFAAALKTSRASLDRLVNPENTSVNLNTLAKAGEVMGKKLELRYV